MFHNACLPPVYQKILFLTEVVFMAHIDKLKEEIGWLKIVFAILIATAISLAAWVIQNYGEANQFLTIGGAIAVLLIWSNSGPSDYSYNYSD